MTDAPPIEHPGWLTGGDFTEADEPWRLFAAWFAEAKRAEPNNPDAMALATVDADGLPNARMVLLKGFDERGFVFYTNIDSVKGHELADAPKAALTFYWKSLQRQVRARGHVEPVTAARGRRLFRLAPADGADRRLGEQTIERARKPAGVREGGRAAIRRSSRSARCRGRRIGRAIAWCRRKSSSGRNGRFGCMIACGFGAAICVRRGPRRGFIREHPAELGNADMPLSNRPGRTLLLTGASRGIGHATVKRFSAAGWRVLTCSRHAFPENCPWEAGPEDHIQVDLGDIDNTDEAIAEIKTRLNGELHALVNNAAISPKADGGKRLDSIATSQDDWHRVFQVNFFAPIMLARGLLDELKAAKGSVVNVTSIAGSRVHPFAGAAYATSKAALAALTREMAADFGAVGVRVNAIAPGEIDTAMLSPGTEKIVEVIPMHRLGTPDEVAKIIYVLCTETSSYVNGAEIHINGGQHV